VARYLILLFLVGCNEIQNERPPLTEEIPVSQVDGMYLTWEPPEFNTDGTPVTDLVGYGIYYGLTPGEWNYLYVEETSVMIENLSPGTWYAVATAWNAQGEESAFSNQTEREIE
jgi:hypothetical protein